MLAEILQREAPKFLHMLEAADPPVAVEVFAANWLLCMMTTTFPTETALRVLDVAVFEGMDIIICVAASFV